MISLRRQITGSLLKLMGAMLVVTGLTSYWVAAGQATELLDSQLRHVALVVEDDVALRHLPTPVMNDDDEDDEVVVQAWDREGRLLRNSRPELSLPRPDASGFFNAESPFGRWRVYAIVSPEKTVLAAQLEVVRQEMAGEAALKALLPLLLLTPLTCLVAWFGVGKVLRPLRRVSAAAAARSLMAQEPLPEDEVPSEIAPMIRAVNELLHRLDIALAAQQRFVSDAAHQLKTPLAALKLQIANLHRSGPGKFDAEDLEARLARLDSGLDRLTRLVNQLLRLARHEGRERPGASPPVAVESVVRQSIESLLPLADRRGVDLGVVQADAAQVTVDEVDLRSLLDNLLDNAVRYTPANGAVDISIVSRAGEVEIGIRDTGPGMAATSLAKAFERFWTTGQNRDEGSGLGLAIAKAIAERHGGRIELNNRTDANGLWARVLLPRLRAHGSEATLVT